MATPLSVLRYVYYLAIWLALCLFSTPAQGQSRYVYQGASLKHVIEDIEQREAYRFLYRDALISGKWVTFEAPPEALISSLKAALLPQKVELRVDEIHRQILLSEVASTSRPAIFRGHVLDHETGSRLPYAHITWIENGRLRGASTNEAGAFHVQIDPPANSPSNIELSVSYIGYASVRVSLNTADTPSELSIRLTPETLQGQEVLINSSMLHTNLDTTWRPLLHPTLTTPFGESSVIRSLQPLPAVALSTALSEGLNVRGSKTDGFQVLLDGAPIYNQNHFFGMFDVFNEDALQTVGFFYDIAPASYFAPPGGTISFITRTGSLSRVRASLGLSNTTARGTLEGPFAHGKASWLISGRHSYLDAVQWFNNEALIGFGMNINRTISELPDPVGELNELIVRPTDSAARFYDLHGKAMYETRKGGNATLTMYLGGNDTRFDGMRLSTERDRESNLLTITENPVATVNRWGNNAASLQLNHRLGMRGFLQTLFSASHYSSRYSKDDFTYTRVNPRNDRPLNFIFPFDFENQLLDLRWAHTLSWAPEYPGSWMTGVAGNYYALNYFENSAMRPAFEEDFYAIQADAFAEYEYTDSDFLRFRTGLRGHYFTQGHVIRISPRAQFTLFPAFPLSFRLGYSRNYQFLHNLYLENINSASIWVITTGSQGPSYTDNYTAGIYIRPAETLFLQVEGYSRTYGDLRRHEINVPSQVASSNAFRFVPWFSDNDAYARGVEAMLRQRIGPVVWTNGYTLSQIELQNSEINDGERFPAEWDRRHQFTSHLEIELMPALKTRFTWYYATGNPNTLSYTNFEELSRLPHYHRLDAGIEFTQQFSGARLTAKVSLYNAYDQANTWRREQIQVFSRSRPERGSMFFPVDIFDLGRQPSFDLSVAF